MSDFADLTVPLSQLRFNDFGGYTLAAHAGQSHLQIGVLLQTAIARFVRNHVDTGTIDLVSASLDITGPCVPDSDTVFAPEIARKTRTLVFAQGLASQSGGPVMRATVVYRIG